MFGKKSAMHTEPHSLIEPCLSSTNGHKRSTAAAWSRPATSFAKTQREGVNSNDSLLQCRQLAPKVSARGSRLFSQGKSILIVDSFPSLRELMRELLEHSGYSVLEAASSSEAIRLADLYPGLIPLIITDLILPGSNGVILAERVREKRRETRVLYAASSQESLPVQTQFGSAHALIEKPFKKDAFLNQVRRLLQ